VRYQQEVAGGYFFGAPGIVSVCRSAFAFDKSKRLYLGSPNLVNMKTRWFLRHPANVCMSLGSKYQRTRLQDWKDGGLSLWSFSASQSFSFFISKFSLALV